MAFPFLPSFLCFSLPSFPTSHVCFGCTHLCVHGVGAAEVSVRYLPPSLSILLWRQGLFPNRRLPFRLDLVASQPQGSSRPQPPVLGL